MPAVVFDLDGTLINSLTVFHDVMAQRIGEHLGRQVTSKEVEQNFHYKFSTIYNRFGIDCERTISDIETGLKIVEQERTEFSLFPGVYDMIKNLHDRGVSTYIWTYRDRVSTLKILDFLDLTQHFDDVFTRCDGDPKPSSYGIRKMIEHKKPDEVFVIGDSLSDMKGAQCFGAHFIGACWAHNTHAEEMAAENVHVATTVDQCTEILLNHYSH